MPFSFWNDDGQPQAWTARRHDWIPASAGMTTGADDDGQPQAWTAGRHDWIPASAGMTAGADDNGQPQAWTARRHDWIPASAGMTTGADDDGQPQAWTAESHAWIPACAGMTTGADDNGQPQAWTARRRNWIPACAGMTTGADDGMPAALSLMSFSQQDIRIYRTTAELMEAAAHHLVQQARQAIEARGTLTLALAGGSTPKSLYALLAAPPLRTQLDWTRIHFFWGDERHVPPDHQDSNYRMARESLLRHLPVAPDHIHRVPSEIPDARTAADRYEDMIRRHFDVPAPEVPRFDCVLLGMGADGHTASLFPGTQAAHEQHRLVTAPWVDTLQTSRITCTPALFNHARHVTFLVQGQHKAHMLRSALEGPLQPDLCPASSIRPQSGTLTWFVDQEAASELSRLS